MLTICDTKHTRPNMVISTAAKSMEIINSYSKNMIHYLICIHEFCDPLNKWPGSLRVV